MPKWRLFRGCKSGSIFKNQSMHGAPGWLSQLSVQLLIWFGSWCLVHEIKPWTRLCADSVEPAWDSLFPSLSLCLSHPPSKINIKKKNQSGAPRVAQSVKCPTSAQIMISWFMSWSPPSGSLLSVQSLLQLFCPSLSLCTPHWFSVSISLNIINLKKNHSVDSAILLGSRRKITQSYQ